MQIVKKTFFMYEKNYKAVYGFQKRQVYKTESFWPKVF